MGDKVMVARSVVSALELVQTLREDPVWVGRLSGMDTDGAARVVFALLTGDNRHAGAPAWVDDADEDLDALALAIHFLVYERSMLATDARGPMEAVAVSPERQLALRALSSAQAALSELAQSLIPFDWDELVRPAPEQHEDMRVAGDAGTDRREG